MSSFRSRNREAAQLAAERRAREDQAPRLVNEVPGLKTLRLEIEERRAGATVPESAHVRHVSVPHAPALFDLLCREPSCTGGGHDVTNAILQALRSRSTRFEGEHACRGSTRDADCTRVLRYIGIAEYD
jgi:hypothetical protein